MRIPSTPLFGRAMAGYGSSVSDERDGPFWLVRGGIEARGCDEHGVWCLFVGLDVGYEHEQFMPVNGCDLYFVHERRGVTVGPRLGIDANSDRWGLRVALEGYRYNHGLEPTFDSIGSMAPESGTGVGLTLAVVRRLGPDRAATTTVRRGTP